MRHVSLLLLLLAAGCNTVFGLDTASIGDGGGDADGGTEIDAALDSPVSELCDMGGGADEDGDGFPDPAICDNCPMIANDGQADDDDDGVGDGCDIPGTSKAHAQFAFHGFGTSNPDFDESDGWAFDGTATLRPGEQIGSILTKRAPIAGDVGVEATIVLGTTTLYEDEIGVVIGVGADPTVRCVLMSLTAAPVWGIATNGQDTVEQPLPVSSDNRYRFALRYDVMTKTATCSVSAAAETAARFDVVAGLAQPRGTAGLRTKGFAGSAAEYLFVIAEPE